MRANSAAREPHDDHAKYGSCNTGAAQPRFGRGQHLGSEAPRDMWHAPINDALDHKKETEGDEKILHGATAYSVAPVVRPAPGATGAAGCCGAVGAALTGRPLELPKKRKNSESGDSSIVVPCPSSARV